MLGRLMKYDFKAVSKFLLVIHAMLLVTALIGRVAFMNRLMISGDVQGIRFVAAVIVGMVFVLLFMVAAVGTQIVLAKYYYQNLFTDEGYLTHTLPVSKGEILGAKTIMGVVWLFVDQMLLVASVLILIATKPMVYEMRENHALIWKILGIPASVGYFSLLGIMALVFLCSGIFDTLAIYASVTIGSLFTNHRVLGAVVSFFCISTVTGLIGSAVGSRMSASAILATESGASITVYPYMTSMFIRTCALDLVLAVIFAGVTYWILKKKVNLS